jgi:hypothetical protein
MFAAVNPGGWRSAISALCVIVLSLPTTAETSRKTFATPEEAARALASAVKTGDDNEVLAILGPSLKDWIESGDPVADKQVREKFVAAFEQKQAVESGEPNTATLVVGSDDFPFPIPLVKSGDKWSFDPSIGKQEIIDRRVGKNELDTIQTLLAIVDAQNEYAALDPAGKGAREYARRFISSVGKRDGLYWPTTGSEPQSPLGPLAAEAALAGYRTSSQGGEASKNPYHGYYFRMLTEQGQNAPGGSYPYLVNGRLIGGFAVIAWPAKYGASGYKTFMVSHDQIVYEADLGPDTAKLVGAIRSFDPGKRWSKVAVE